ncbi:MAG: SDR family oxidoreductase [Acidobacteria bacterium]|nr:SDR family oxidoreductase [Acidobacteriota bacterium]MSO62890.1 SDR family oxidoreductase [Acidobacteriota bacterium]
MELNGKVVLITGGKRIGAVVATTLAKAGADMAMVYNRSRAEADETVAAVRALGRKAVSVQADVSSEHDCAQAVDATVAQLGRLDILINMASLYGSKPFDQLSAADWDRQMSVDLRATFLCSRAAAIVMKRVGGGRIINFADWVVASGRPRYPGFLPYYVAKAGVKALTEALALELAADQILVNAIAPGPILAPPGMSEKESASVVRNTPLGRWGGETEIAKAVMFLVQSDFVTGETIRVDGGRHVR